MTDAINTKSEGLELRALSFEELDVVTGGDAKQQAQENKKQSELVKLTKQILNGIL